jgi:2-keto-4-pentenoate hydratase/2-oxohepta-3-ene-1,7-dioic acid hydratase in catechol pathway
MKLVSFRVGSTDSYGILMDKGIVDLGKRHPYIPDLKSFLASSEFASGDSQSLSQQDHALDAVTLLPPIPNPDKIICVGVNYHAHLAEIGMARPDHPMIFVRFANSQVGHGQPLVRPIASEQFDYEGELAVVICKRVRRIERSDALDVVAGYACYNEGTIRDWQSHTRQVAPGKNFPATAGFGPWLITKDDVPELSQLTLTTRINGLEVQRAKLDDMIFSVQELISYCSKFTELVPGDVISTGTTGGVGAYRKPPLWMKPGDMAEVEISHVGLLRNPVIAEEA